MITAGEKSKPEIGNQRRSFSDQVLTADDIDQNGNTHREDCGHDPRPIDIGLAEVGDEEREGQRYRKAEHEEGNRERQTGKGAGANALRDRHAVGIALAEIEAQHPREVVVEQGVGEGGGSALPRPPALTPPITRLVVAVVLEPLLDHLRARLVADGALGDVAGISDLKEEQEQDQQHPQHREDPLKQPADQIGTHVYCRSRKKVTTPGTTRATQRPANAYAGQRIG